MIAVLLAVDRLTFKTETAACKAGRIRTDEVPVNGEDRGSNSRPFIVLWVHDLV
jgi:hypothetical protein